MWKIICASGLLLLIGVLQGCCTTKQDSIRLTDQGIHPNLDERVQIVFGPSRHAPRYSFVSGSIFLWDGFQPVSEEAFCAGIREESANAKHFEIVLDPHLVSDISVREFIHKLAYLRYVCLNNLAPNATMTLYVSLTVSPDPASPTTTTSPVTGAPK
jgi:hypothetical protein